ncbi:hypothetical protein WMW72_34295 [Paenibacillus filicis]|uniref:HTH LytTR-type domain-containing protein n=1 Tax=Paenibacillus filicis TaxID=669464 RepID=A0ABU9DVX9_9BACL
MIDWIKHRVSSELQTADSEVVKQLLKNFEDSLKTSIQFIDLESNFIVIEHNDVFYVTIDRAKRQRIVTSRYGTFITKEEILENIEGVEDFASLGKTLVVNMSNIKKYHSHNGTLFFDLDALHSVQIQLKLIPYVIKQVGQENDLYSPLNYQYAPLNTKKV